VLEERPSRGSFARKTIALLSLLVFAGCVPIPPVATPAPETRLEPQRAELAIDRGAGDAVGGISLLPAWRDTENILILGADHDVRSGNWRTDAMMVLGLDRTGKRAALLSVPRDLYVDIPGHDGGRISTVDALGERSVGVAGGGPELVAQALEQILGLRIDHWIRVEIGNLRQFIDRLGGINIHLDCPFYEPILNLDSGQWEYLALPAGDVLMDGETVYWFVRLRLLEGDAGRTARQRQLLFALRDQAFSTGALQKLPQLIDEFGSMVATDMTVAELLDAARTGLAIEPDNIHSGRLDDDGVLLFRTAYGIEVLRIADAERVHKTVNALWNGPTAGAIRNGQSARCTKPSPELLDSLTREYAADQLNNSFDVWGERNDEQLVTQDRQAQH
jgi:LCP family protein required for cell wall assembly